MIENKEELIEEIKRLISIDGSAVEINPKYLEYFELDELQEIKDTLDGKKKDHDAISNDYLDELFNKCS